MASMHNIYYSVQLVAKLLQGILKSKKKEHTLARTLAKHLTSCVDVDARLAFYIKI